MPATNSTTPITPVSESTIKNKVIFDRAGNIITVTDPFLPPSGEIEAIGTKRLFIDTLNQDATPNRSMSANVGDLAIIPQTEFSLGDDWRTEVSLQPQTAYIGVSGASGNPTTGVTSGTTGYGQFQFNEPVRQSNHRPSVFVGVNNTTPRHKVGTYKFGYSSLQFFGNDGVVGASGGCVRLDGITVDNAGTVVYGIELFFNAPAAVLGATGTSVLLAKRPDPALGSTIDNEMLLYFDGAAGLLRFSFLRAGQTGSFSNTLDIYSLASITADQWHHVAVAQRGGQWTNTFFNGAVAGTAGSAVSYHPGGATFSIGADHLGSNPFQGYIDNLRMFTAPTGGATGYQSYWSGTTCPVPTGQSDIDDLDTLLGGTGSYTKYLIKANGISGSNLVTVDTPSYAEGVVGHFNVDGRLTINHATKYGTGDGFTANASWGYAHGLSSGSAYIISSLTTGILGLTLGKEVARATKELAYLTELFDPIEGTGGNTATSNPFQYLFGFTGGGNTYHSGYFGPTGSTSNYFSYIPSTANLTDLSNFINAYQVNGTYSIPGSTMYLADATGTAHAFTKVDMQNLFIDLYRYFATLNYGFGDVANQIQGSTNSNLYQKKVILPTDFGDYPFEEG